MTTFWLKVIASDHVFYNGNCEALVVPAHDGEVGILPHREAMILAIQEGELKFRIPGEQEYHHAVVCLGIALIPVCNGSLTGCLSQMPGAGDSTGLYSVVSIGPAPSIGWPMAFTTRPIIASPTGTLTTFPVRLTVCPSLIP